MSSLHSVSRDGNFSIYVSSEGRVFNRFSYGGSDNGKYMQSSSSQIAGQPSDLHARNINFQGSTITVTMPMVAGARQIVARFEGDFANCNAQVITGKASPQSPIKMRTLNAGNAEFEIHSIRTGAATCKVQTGNVFASGIQRRQIRLRPQSTKFKFAIILQTARALRLLGRFSRWAVCCGA